MNWQESIQAHARPERDPLMDLFSDSFTGIPSLRLADQLKGLGADVWSYRFDYQKASPIGAAHASDIAFTFGKPNEAPFPVEWTKQAPNGVRTYARQLHCVCPHR